MPSFGNGETFTFNQDRGLEAADGSKDEVTPEMIEAGEREIVQCLGFGDPSGEPYGVVAERVWRAMEHVRRPVWTTPPGWPS